MAGRSKKGQVFSEPLIEQRSEQPYFGIRTQVPMKEIKKAIPKCLEEVFAWLGKQGIAPAGAPFIRYHVINMAGMMDIEMGVPVANAIPEAGLQNDPPMTIRAGTLPAGQYAALIYIGVKNGIKANAALLDWGTKQGLVWDRWDVEHGDAFRSRYETFITDPKDEPDPAKWETEVAIRLAEQPTR